MFVLVCLITATFLFAAANNFKKKHSRGFAFAEFESPREAENCINALKDTHLLGRRLVLDYAEAEAVDAEEEIAKMQKKIGGQVNKVAVQKLLTAKGRQRFEVGEEQDDDA